MQNQLPQRKQIRLKYYDYSETGYYFITICTKDRKQILSKIINESEFEKNRKLVGVALLGDPQKKIILTKQGMIVEKHIKNCNTKFDNLFIDEYVIMPNHIHLIIVLAERVAQECDPYNT